MADGDYGQRFRLVVGSAGVAVQYQSSIIVPGSTAPLVVQRNYIPKQLTFTQDDGHVISIEAELKTEGHRVSLLTATLHDPQFQILSQLQDPAFSNVPVRLFLSSPRTSSTPEILVFQGIATAYQFGYPAYDKLTIVAHDASVGARRQRNYNVIKGQTSLQIAQQLMLGYGMQVQTIGAVSVTSRAIAIQGDLSDWDYVIRECNFDGLETYIAPNASGQTTLYIRNPSSAPAFTLYGTFQRDKFPVIRLEGAINHVGDSSDKRGSVSLENAGTYRAAQDPNTQARQNAEQAKQRQHRRPVGAATSENQSHAEQPGNAGWTNQITKVQRRKDEATLELYTTPDIGLQHYVILNGWGAKVDGAWYIRTVRHVLVPGDGYRTTSLSMTRTMSKSATNTAGVPFGQ